MKTLDSAGRARYHCAMPEVPAALILLMEDGRLRTRPLVYHAQDREEARRVAGAMREVFRRCAREAQVHGGRG